LVPADPGFLGSLVEAVVDTLGPELTYRLMVEAGGEEVGGLMFPEVAFDLASRPLSAARVSDTGPDTTQSDSRSNVNSNWCQHRLNLDPLAPGEY
jgi:hypothetical protein